MAFMLACREISSRRTSVILVRGCEFVVLFLIPLSSALCQSQTINFAEYSGPSIFSAVDPPLQVGPATLSGGQILTDATNAPADEGTIYGTANFCSGCLPTITVDFSVPVSQLSMFLINGETFTVTYTVVDNQGGSQTITLVANFNSGAGTVALPESGITQVKVTGSAGTWDFAIGSVTFTPGATVLVDPVPNASCAGTCLLNGPAVTKDANLLATVGTIVQGIAADGVAQVLVRIPAQVGQQISLSLAPTSSNTVLGALADPLNAGSFEGVGPLTVTAVNTTAGPMAFALYQAPLDFSQGGPDNAASQRTVSLQIQVGSGPVNTTTITILRPPVVLIHGLWDSSNEWTTFQNNFNTLATTQSFFVETVDYSQAVSGIKSTSPAYTTAQLGLVKASALGFGYNTPGVLNKINQIVNDFRATNSAAAVQADVVAHSMGGDITRSLRFVPGFTSSSNFDKGNVHKLITIGTPHLGSPLAIQLLNTNNACVATLMASKGNISFSTVTLSSGQTYTGGVGDLQGNGTGGGLSEALIALQSSFVIPFPTALVAGVMSSTNLSGVDCSLCAAGYIRNKCGSPSFFNRSAPSDPLAVNLTSTGWPTILGGSSDAVVPLTSEFNGASATSPGMEIKGIVHSAGMEVLDFGGPAEVDYSAVAAQIIVLLNEMVSGVDYNPL